jgi:hypothetical protein
LLLILVNLLLEGSSFTQQLLAISPMVFRLSFDLREELGYLIVFDGDDLFQSV